MRHLVFLLLPALLGATEPDPSREPARGEPVTMADSNATATIPASPSATVASSSPLAPKTNDAPSSISPLAAAGASLLVPGLGQWLTGHPVRGSLLGVLELWLYGDALQRCQTGIPGLRSERDALFVETRLAESAAQQDTSLETASRIAKLRDALSEANGNANISTDYVHSEIAWALGVHAWGVVDAAESAWLRNGGIRPQRTMAQAAWASALVPGLGQILNGHYSKAALLYMAILGASVSLDGRQGMVDFWKDEGNLAATQGRSTSYASEQADFFRKRRNQYIWGLGLLYVYQILDATVDARLARIETTPSFTLSPTLDGRGLTASLRF